MFKLFVLFILSIKLSYAQVDKILKNNLVVGILDTGIDFSNSQLKHKFVIKNDQGTLTSPHSTHLACMINTVNDKLKFVSYNYLMDKNKTEGILNGLKFMIRHKVNYILYPSSGKEYSAQEESLLKLASEDGIIIFVSAGNDSEEIGIGTERFPCSLKIKNLFCVGNKANYSNKGSSIVSFDEGLPVESCGLNNNRKTMKGTSQSTAQFLAQFSKL